MKTTINRKLIVIVALMGMLVPSTMSAQDTFEVTIGADFVNKYVWRGFDQGSGASIQPTLGLAWKGISLSAWGSTSITALEPKEFDISLGYESAAFNMSENLENSAVAKGLEKVSFHSNPKERQCQRMLKLPHNCNHLSRLEERRVGKEVTFGCSLRWLWR